MFKHLLMLTIQQQNHLFNCRLYMSSVVDTFTFKIVKRCKLTCSGQRNEYYIYFNRDPV